MAAMEAQPRVTAELCFEMPEPRKTVATDEERIMSLAGTVLLRHLTALENRLSKSMTVVECNENRIAALVLQVLTRMDQVESRLIGINDSLNNLQARSTETSEFSQHWKSRDDRHGCIETTEGALREVESKIIPNLKPKIQDTMASTSERQPSFDKKQEVPEKYLMLSPVWCSSEHQGVSNLELEALITSADPGTSNGIHRAPSAVSSLDLPVPLPERAVGNREHVDHFQRNQSLKYANTLRDADSSQGSISQEYDRNNKSTQLQSMKICCGLIHIGPRATRAIKGFLDAVFGISDRDILHGIPGSRIICPSSPFSAFVEGMSALLLVYCICILPIELSFWNNLPPCQAFPTIKIDMFTDAFFLFELVCRFFIGIDINGQYCDDLGVVAKTYVTAIDQFWFDAFTSLPLSWVDYFLLQDCEPEEGGGGFRDSGFFRMVRTLRFLKLSRLLKIFKIFSIATERLDISPSKIRILKLLLVLGGAMHLYACAFWRVKNASNSEQDVRDWLAARNVKSTDVGKMYVVCFYFVCTVFTTVGFGDIAATGNAERIFCIFTMATAACVFGSILGELQDTFASSHTKSRELEDRIESVMGFLHENRVPKHVVRRVKAWIRFQFSNQRAETQNKSVMDSLPPVLRQTLACAMNRGLFSKVSLWARITNIRNLRDQFTSELLLRMHTAFYLAGSSVVRHTEKADRLMILVEGSLKIYEPNRIGCEDAHLLTLGPGQSIGDNAVLGDERWGGFYGVDVDIVACDNVKICYLMCHDIEEVVNSQPVYTSIRKMLQWFTYDPTWEDYVGPALETWNQITENMQANRIRRASIVNRSQERHAVFHWIRMARTKLNTAHSGW